SQGEGQSLRRENAADHAKILYHSSQFLNGRRNVLERQKRHTAEAAILGEKLFVEKIVIGTAEFYGVARIADLADMHKARRIENRKVDISLVELPRPFAPVRHAEVLLSKVVRRNRSMPAMMRHQRKVEHRLPPRTVASGHIFHDLLIGLAYVAVGIDDVS